MGNLIGHLWERHAAFLAWSALLLAGFQFLLCAIVASVDLGGALHALLQSLPPLLQAGIGDQILGGMTQRGLLAFGWNHPIAQALGTAVAIVLGARAIAGEIEHGTIEMVLGQPLSRLGYLAAHVLFAFAALALLSVLGVVGTVAGQASFRLEPFAPLVLSGLAVNYFLLQAVWFSLALALSALGREAGWVASAAFLLALTSYLVQVIGRLWSAAAFLLPWSLHDYYSPQAILLGGAPPGRSLGVLTAVLALSLGFAGWRFLRRDVP